MLYPRAEASEHRQLSSEKRAASLGRGWGKGGFDERVAEDDAADATEAVDSDVDRSLSGRPASIPAVYGKR